jgi:phosphatidylglycerol:prolipoprotein diacylglycerol transferase
VLGSLNPILFQIGPFTVHWYGLFMAISVGLGFYYLLRDGKRLGYSEDFLYNLTYIIVIAGVIGARLIYVVTNWDYFSRVPWDIVRVDLGGLSIHGAVLGGALAALPYLRKHKASFNELADLVVPGIGVGIALVRWANIVNHEVMGRFTTGGFQHPAQIYGSMIGVTLLIINAILSRKKPPAGYRFWSFVLYYTLLRGIIEETFRANPLYAVGWVTSWGGGFFTLTQLLTPLIAVCAWWFRRRTLQVQTSSHQSPNIPEQNERGKKRNGQARSKKGK